MIPTYLDHHPSGTSTRPLIHYAQLNDANDRFVNYDFGTPKENVEHYGTTEPPGKTRIPQISGSGFTES